VLYWSEIWPLTLSQEYKFTGFDTRLQVATRMEEVTVVGRKLGTEELRNFYSSLNVASMIEKHEMGGTCSTPDRVNKQT
jgi:hypothetical protein